MGSSIPAVLCVITELGVTPDSCSTLSVNWLPKELYETKGELPTMLMRLCFKTGEPETESCPLAVPTELFMKLVVVLSVGNPVLDAKVPIGVMSLVTVPLLKIGPCSVDINYLSVNGGC